MSDEKKMKIVMGPGFQESVDTLMQTGTPEEIAEFQAFMDSVREMAEDGTLQENSEPVDMDELEKTNPGLAEKLLQDVRGAHRLAGEDPDLDDAIDFFTIAKESEENDAIRKNFFDLHQWLIELKGARKKLSSLDTWMKEVGEEWFKGAGREAEWTMHLLRSLRERVGVDEVQGGPERDPASGEVIQ